MIDIYVTSTEYGEILEERSTNPGAFQIRMQGRVFHSKESVNYQGKGFTVVFADDPSVRYIVED